MISMIGSYCWFLFVFVSITIISHKNLRNGKSKFIVLVVVGATSSDVWGPRKATPQTSLGPPKPE